MMLWAGIVAHEDMMSIQFRTYDLSENTT